VRDPGLYAPQPPAIPIAALHLLEDLDRIFQFIEARDENAGMFSHRTYELLLRACTEFESVCKDLMMELSLAKHGEQLSVTRYVKLEDRLQLEKASPFLCGLMSMVTPTLRA
jgi:hypothetical protein